MRLFVAVDLSADAIAEADRVAHAIRSAAPRLDARWVPPENMHLTVRFIGHVADDVGQRLIEAVTRPIPVPPFALTLGGCGSFPGGAPRVLWIGLQSGGAELARISRILDERVRPFGYEPESREFTAHLTLARAARGGRMPAAVRESVARIAVHPVVTEVGEAVLYRSHLSPRGARYEPLVRIPLAAESALPR